jgi:hypothetical protein
MSRHINLVDAHVHVYPGADVGRLLDSAAVNFARAANAVGAKAWQGNLLLTETMRVEWFDSIAAAGERSFGRWHLKFSSDDPINITANSSAGSEILRIVAGRQIVTAEKIEVHALGTRAKFSDGMEAHATLKAAAQSGAMVVLPWGVGKWTGRRGRLVESLMQDSQPRTLFVSDNGGRPTFWADWRLAVTKQPVLRGSDPLPLPGEESRVGESGIWFDGLLPDRSTALDMLMRISAANPEAIYSYGPAESIFRFVRNQLLLRMGKRTDVV